MAVSGESTDADNEFAVKKIRARHRTYDAFYTMAVMVSSGMAATGATDRSPAVPRWRQPTLKKPLIPPCPPRMVTIMRKIERNIDKYGLEGLNAELQRQHQDNASLRDLATYINQRILTAALTAANVSVVGDIEDIYETLRGDEVSVGQRAEMSARLARRGVPMEEVENDFVSHQTVSDYLNDCLDMDTSRQHQLTIDEALKTIEWAEARGEAVIDRTLTRLYEAGELASAADEVSCSLYVTCEHCNKRSRLYEFLEQGGCTCTAETADDARDAATSS